MKSTIFIICLLLVIIITFLSLSLQLKIIYRIQKSMYKAVIKSENDLNPILKKKTDIVLELMILDRFINKKQNRKQFVTYISTQTFEMIVEYGGKVKQYCFYEPDIKELQKSKVLLYQRFGYWLDWLCNQPEGTKK